MSKPDLHFTSQKKTKEIFFSFPAQTFQVHSRRTVPPPESSIPDSKKVQPLSPLPKLQVLPRSTCSCCVILTSSSFLLISTSNTSLLDWLQFWQSLTWYCINIEKQKARSQLDNCILVLCYMICGTYKCLRTENKVIIGTRHLVSQSQKIFFIS